MREGKRRHMIKFLLNEISAVDEPAQIGARAILMKRADPKEIVKAAALTSAVDGHTHLIDTVDFDGMEQRAGTTSWQDDHSHPWIIDDAGVLTIGEVDGHTHSVDTFVKGAEAEILIRSVLGKAASTEVHAMPGKDNKTTLTPEAALEAATAALTKSEESLTAVTDELAALKAKHELPEKERKIVADLDEDSAEKFMKMTTDERTAEVARIEKVATDADPIIYTSTGGDEFRKSDDPRLVKMAKKADADAKENADLRKAAETTEFTKRAETELEFLPGTVEVRSAILKAVAGIEDKDTRAEAEKALKAHNAKLSGSFTTVGHSVAKAEDGSDLSKADAGAELDRLAKALAEKDGVEYLDAYEKVSETHPDLLHTAIAG